MKKNKTKYIYECLAERELTEFNEGFNKKLKSHCERKDKFIPTLQCMQHSKDAGYCRYLKIHTYKGG